MQAADNIAYAKLCAQERHDRAEQRLEIGKVTEQQITCPGKAVANKQWANISDLSGEFFANALRAVPPRQRRKECIAQLQGLRSQPEAPAHTLYVPDRLQREQKAPCRKAVQAGRERHLSDGLFRRIGAEGLDHREPTLQRLHEGESWDDYKIEVTYEGVTKEKTIRLFAGDKLEFSFNFDTTDGGNKVAMN